MSNAVLAPYGTEFLCGFAAFVRNIKIEIGKAGRPYFL